MRLYILIIFIALVISALIYFKWNSPSQMIAIGSLLGASISSIALAYNVMFHNNLTKKEAKLEFIKFLPATKQALTIDVKQIVAACEGTVHFLELHNDKIPHPELFLSAVVNDDTICKLIVDDLKSGNIILKAAVDAYQSRYSKLQKEAKEFDADFYFEVLIGELGYGALLKKLDS